MKEVSNSAKCKFPFTPEKTDPQIGRLRVGEGGRRISGTGFSPGQNGRLVLTKRGDDPQVGHYRGRKRGAKIDWRVFSPSFMQGKTTLKLTRGGRSCTLTRNFDARRLGE